MPNLSNQEKFNKNFNHLWEIKPLDFDALEELLKPFFKQEGLTGPARKLSNYLSDFKDSLAELTQDGQYDAYVDFANLSKCDGFLYNFLEAYDSDVSENPAFETLLQFNRNVQVLGMLRASDEYVNYFNEKKTALKYVKGNKDKLNKVVSKFCNDVNRDGFNVDNLSEYYENGKKEIEALKKKIAEEEEEIGEYKLMNTTHKSLSDRIFKNPAYIMNQKYIDFFNRRMLAADPKENKALAEADKAIEDLSIRIAMLEEQIKKDQAAFDNNYKDNSNYQQASFVVGHMGIQKDMAAKGITSDKLKSRHNILEKAFGDLAYLSMSLQQRNVNMKTEFKNNSQSKTAYMNAKEAIILNFGDTPKETEMIRNIFAKIEKNNEPQALELLVSGNVGGFKTKMDNIKKDYEELEIFEDAVKTVEATKINAQTAETAKMNIEAAKKEIEASKLVLNRAVAARSEERKIFTDDINFPKEDLQYVSGLSNKEFYQYLSLKKGEYLKKKDELLTTGELKEPFEKLQSLSDKKSLHTLDDLEKQKRTNEVLLDRVCTVEKKLQNYLVTQSNLKDETAKVTAMADVVFKQLNDESAVPDKYQFVTESLKKIQDRLNKPQNGAKNTRFYENMCERLDNALRAIKNGHPGIISGALDSLAYEADRYITEQNGLKKKNPSAADKLRLCAAQDLKAIGNNAAFLMKESQSKTACDKFTQEYKDQVGNSGLLFDKLKKGEPDAIDNALAEVKSKTAPVVKAPAKTETNIKTI